MNYWDKRYLNGGTSGQGSIGKLREWKWKIIEKYGGCGESIIDVGCGDLSFWGDIPIPDKYIGIDSSKIIIQTNIKKYPLLNFYVSPIQYNIKSDTVICFDMLFHVMDDTEYIKILHDLCKYSNNKIFIYTWIKNPLQKKWFLFETLYDEYEKYHNPMIILKIILNDGFILENLETNDIDEYGGMFIFKK